MDARLTSHSEHYNDLARCAYTAKEAADMLGVSEATVRRVAKSLGVNKISGRVIAGFVRFPSHPVDVSMPYSA
jgi:DeoR/GlpR family transcriptional regulator of sugar metabolism